MPCGIASPPIGCSPSPPLSTPPGSTPSRSPTATAWPAAASTTARAATPTGSGSRPRLESIKNARLTTLLLPGVGTIAELKHAYDLGVRSVRVATHCTEADVAAQHIATAREIGMDVAGFLMMSPHGPGRRTRQAGEADGVLRRALRLCHRLRRPTDHGRRARAA